MARSDQAELVHSVAFRVTEAQWTSLQKWAKQEATTIPQLAKLALFERLGIEDPPRKKGPYGQKPHRTRQVVGF